MITDPNPTPSDAGPSRTSILAQKSGTAVMPPKERSWPIKASVGQQEFLSLYTRGAGRTYLPLDLIECPWKHPVNLEKVYNFKEATAEQFDPVWNLLHGEDSELPQPLIVICDENLYCYDTSRRNRGDRVIGPRLPCVFSRFWVDDQGNLVLGDCEYHSHSKNCHHRNLRYSPIWDRTPDGDTDLTKDGLSLTSPNYVRAPVDNEILNYTYEDGTDRREYCDVKDWADRENGILPDSGSRKRHRSSLALEQETLEKHIDARQKRKYTKRATAGPGLSGSPENSSRNGATTDTSPTAVGSSPHRDVSSSAHASPSVGAPAKRRGRPPGKHRSKGHPRPSSSSGGLAVPPRPMSQSSLGSTSAHIAALQLDSRDSDSPTDTLRVLQDRLESVQRRGNRRDEEIESLQMEISLLQRYRDLYLEVKDENKQLDEECQYQVKRVDDLSEFNRILRETIQLSDHTKELLQTKIERADDLLADKDDEIARGKTALSKATAQIAKANLEHQEHESKSAAALVEAQRERDTAKGETAKATKDLEDLRTKHQSLKKHYAAALEASEANSKLRSAVEEKDKRIKALKASEAELKAWFERGERLYQQLGSVDDRGEPTIVPLTPRQHRL